MLSPKSQISGVATNIRLVCACARISEDDGLLRDCKVRTQRSSADDDGCCKAALNLYWDKTGCGCWQVGKITTTHTGHFASIHVQHTLNDEQKERFGAAMVDAQLSADQVFTDLMLSVRAAVRQFMHAFS